MGSSTNGEVVGLTTRPEATFRVVAPEGWPGTHSVYVGVPLSAKPESVKFFVSRHPELVGTVAIPGIAEPFEITKDEVMTSHTLPRVKMPGAGHFVLDDRQGGKVFR